MAKSYFKDLEGINKSWIEFHKAFKKEIYPVCFEPFGFTLQEAILAYRMEKYLNLVADMLDEIPPKEKEPWKY